MLLFLFCRASNLVSFSVSRALCTDTEIPDFAAEAQIAMSIDHEQHLNAESLMQESQNDEAEFTGSWSSSSSTKYKECPRWSSSDSVVPAFEKELPSCDLPANDAEPNATFTVEIDSLVSYTTPPAGLLDPKSALKIAYDIDESVGIEISNTNRNETFELKGSKHDCISSSANALSPIIFLPAPLHTEYSSDNEAESHGRQSSDKNNPNMKGKVSNCRSDFEMADDELDSSLSFKLQNVRDVGGRVVHITSTPVASPAANCGGNILDDTELTVKPVRRTSSAEREFSKYIPSARRMLQMCKVKEGNIRKRTDAKFQNFGVIVLDSDNSFSVSPSEQNGYDEIFVDAGCKHNQTYAIIDLGNSANRDFSRNFSPRGYLTSVGYKDFKAREHRMRSSVEKSFRRDASFILRRAADERNSFSLNDDLDDLSIIDVFNDNDIASFFVTEFPSVLAGNCHDLLLSACDPQSIPLVQTKDINSPHHTRTAAKSANSLSDLLTEWSFSRLFPENACPSFDASSVYESDSSALPQRSSLHRFLNATRQLQLDKETRRLNYAGKYQY